LEKIISLKIPYLIIDRMPFIRTGKDRLTVQRVHPLIYEASYPAWFFSYPSFMDHILKKYTLIAEYPCEDRANIPSEFKGLILKLK
jgi:putative methyltransferase (TIGR04325 family)